jgi:hypothetical protein
MRWAQVHEGRDYDWALDLKAYAQDSLGVPRSMRDITFLNRLGSKVRAAIQPPLPWNRLLLRLLTMIIGYSPLRHGTE